MTCFNSAGIGGIGSRRSFMEPSAALRTTDVELAAFGVLVRDNRRGNGRRGFPCGRCAAQVMASETVSRFFRSSAVCQPGLYSRLPCTPTFAARALQLARCLPAPAPFRLRGARCRPGPASCPASRAAPDTALRRRCRRRVRTAPAPRARPPRPARRRSGRRGFSLANFAAYSPARLPKTSRSDSELPPSRLAPCSPAAHSPAANRPGHVRHLRVAVHADAAHHVMRGRADLHRLLGDVDVRRAA